MSLRRRKMAALRLADIMPKELKEKLKNAPLLEEVKGVIGFETPFMREKGLIPDEWELYNFFYTIRKKSGAYTCEYFGHIERELYGNREIDTIEGKVKLGWTEVKQIIKVHLDYACVYNMDYLVFTLNGRDFFCRSLNMDEWEVNGRKVSSRAIANLLRKWLK